MGGRKSTPLALEETVSSKKLKDTAHTKFANNWATGDLCDLVLIVEGKRFPVHKTFLAVFSSYISTCLEYSVDTNEIHLDDLSSAGLKAVLEFIYTQTVTISMETVHRVIQASNCLQIDELTDHCFNFLSKRQTMENCIDDLNFLNQLQLTSSTASSSVNAIITFIAHKFSQITANTMHLALAVDSLCLVLKSDELIMDSEMQVFSAADSWLNASPGRMKYRLQVINCVRFGLLKDDEVVKLIRHPHLMTEDLTSLREDIISYRINATTTTADVTYISRKRTPIEFAAAAEGEQIVSHVTGLAVAPPRHGCLICNSKMYTGKPHPYMYHMLEQVRPPVPELDLNCFGRK